MRIGKLATLLLFNVAGVVAIHAAPGQPTRVVVHVLARDAKLIGSHVGGARISIRETATGRLLASGMQQGETGDTKAIMKEPHVRGASLYTSPGAARFETTIVLTEPTRVTIAAEGPLISSQATQRTETTMVLLPGHDVTGDGIVLELHGFLIDLTEPAATWVPGATQIPLKVRVTMACGCPIEPQGLWDAGRMAIEARLLRGKTLLQTVPLSYAGTPSTFGASLGPLKPGHYTIEITAADDASANFGVFRTSLRVR